jgi:hypothetical protein
MPAERGISDIGLSGSERFVPPTDDRRAKMIERDER